MIDQPALHRKMIKSGLMTKEESERQVREWEMSDVKERLTYSEIKDRLEEDEKAEAEDSIGNENEDL